MTGCSSPKTCIAPTGGKDEGGLFDPWSSMAFFKRLADILNHEHWGIPKARADILRLFRERYGIALSESSLAEIYSVEFLNSICVIRKRPSADNILGPRVVEGEEAIAERLVAGSGSLSSPADQGDESVVGDAATAGRGAARLAGRRTPLARAGGYDRGTGGHDQASKHGFSTSRHGLLTSSRASSASRPASPASRRARSRGCAGR